MMVTKKPLVVALGAAFALTGAVAQASVFHSSDLGAGYMVAAADAVAPASTDATPANPPKQDKKSSELKCGEHKPAKAKAADGKPAEGKCGEGKCGEGKCGQMKKK